MFTSAIMQTIITYYQTTNFIDSSKLKKFADDNFKFEEKLAESYPNGQKTLWEKEKLLVTSNFSFSPSVSKRLVSQGRQKVSLCGNGLTGL